MGYTKEQLLACLQELEIDFTCHDHPVVLTVAEQAKYVGHLEGALSKNLLLKDKKHRLYIVSALAGTQVDMKILSQRLGLGKGGLRMASEENLQEVLQVPLGCVTPFALINESASSAVSLLLDQGFKSQERCYFHPLTNDVTIALSSSNLEKFLISIGKPPAYVDLEASPVVRKDNPPDLAHLVPSGVSDPLEAAENVTPANVPQQNNVPKEKTCVSEAKSNPKVQNKGTEKSQSRLDQPTNATSVEKFVNDTFDIISPLFLSEISKKLNVNQEELTSILDGVRGHVTPDLESITMSLKNAVYTAGFQAGFETMVNSGSNGRPSRK